MKFIVIGKRGAGKTTVARWFANAWSHTPAPDIEAVADTSTDFTADELWAYKQKGYVVVRVFAERWRRLMRLHLQELDDTDPLAEIKADHTIGNYSSLTDLNQQLMDVLRHEESRV